MGINMKAAILLVSFGTSHKDARENSLNEIERELEKAGKNLPVYQAYTSGMIIRKLAGEKSKVKSVEEALKEALDHHIRRLYVVSTHMIPGSEYHKMLRVLEAYRAEFEVLKAAAPVLDKEEDCEKLISVMEEILKPDPSYEYVLMGHGTEAEANVRYSQMNQAFEKAGLRNVRIASVEAKPDLEDALLQLSGKKNIKKVLLHPFMIVAGDHAKNDMAGEEGSYLSHLKQEGYLAEATVKGLGEYAVFRQIFVKKLEELLSQDSSEKENTMSGILYGVGVGPGDAELLTLKAVRIIKECDVIGIPVKEAASCTAYRIAAEAVPEIKEKPVMSFPVPMTTDKDRLIESYERGTSQLIKLIKEGKKIAFLNLGDPTIYGTYMQFHERVLKQEGSAQIISGVPSFCAVAAALGIPLAAEREMLHVLPGFYHGDAVKNYGDTRILMKSAGRTDEVKAELLRLEEEGKIKAYAVTDCGMENQTICRDIRNLDEKAGYFTTVIVKEKRK